MLEKKLKVSKAALADVKSIKKDISIDLDVIVDIVRELADEQKDDKETIQAFGTFIYWNVFGDTRRSHGEALQAIKKRGAMLLKQYKFKHDPKWRNPRDPPGSEYH